MHITYLGHAGFCVETEACIIIMDPWLSIHGAFDSAWFQYPPNHHLQAFVQAKLSSTTHDKYVYISHEHQDHFDIEFLKALMHRDFTLIVAAFLFPVIQNKLASIAYECKQIIALKDAEVLQLNDASIRLFLIDSELNCDSAILVQSAQGCFLNANDCKLHDRLPRICSDYGPIDVFTIQFSGASWYPTCYQLSSIAYREASRIKVANKFNAIRDALAVVKPRLFIPSAGPPCFLDPELIGIHAQPLNTYPRAEHLMRYLTHSIHQGSSPGVVMNPGDAVHFVLPETFTFKILPRERRSFKRNLMHYAQAYAVLFEARQKQHADVVASVVFTQLLEELHSRLAVFFRPEGLDFPRLYWRIREHKHAMYCIDLQHKTIRVCREIDNTQAYCRITAPAYCVQQVLSGQLSWSELALTFRVQLERVPDVYNTLMHGFLIVDTDKLNSFCRKMAAQARETARITVQDGARCYSILRYCPHQGADLSEGLIQHGRLICPRHQWSFDLAHAGQCVDNATSIDARQLPDVEL